MSSRPDPDHLHVVLCTCPPNEAQTLARTVVEQRVAACVNILPTIQSVYRWEDTVVDEAESLLMIKTTAQRSKALFALLAERHPYAVPEIISLPSDSVLPSYLAWVHDETRPNPESTNTP